ncbi:Anti-sigma regulatory factor (Ser/Thr protein kinase) [Thermomonospora echinospora]|uniref:Anti-sigma regulatory factor (Ser/Thr protein kinase) n=1 Tax=Thermomonospora echinospora TaxID=1992 RepID=A0A1H5S8Q5_9ACTN|nr:ATP-binding protein [Thermomonospora echinospora]SEF46197.1 Anti-sigma regulatory factor (Ser/Thr protein kinase) [Thermomonospora echinospora]
MTNERVHRRAFKGEPAELARVRSFAAAALRGCSVLDDAVLLIDEVAANAIVHTDSETVEVALRHVGDVVRGEVRDAGSDSVPAPKADSEADGEGESGRGLLIVDLLAKQWGSRRTAAGRLVWFELHDPDCAPEPPEPESTST